jgi:hypothetical protein
MNRADLSWALLSVLPHVGRLDPVDVVGLTSRDGDAYVWATDRYTSGIARVAGSDPLDVKLSPTEAKELERFVRPSYRDEEAGEITVLAQPGELHVGLERQVHRDGTTESDTAVFETVDNGLTLDFLLNTAGVMFLSGQLDVTQLVYRPSLTAKFAKAQRSDVDQLTIYPRKQPDWPSGAALVTVGADFLGMIAGLTEQPEASTVESFLLSLERGAA